MSLLHRLRSLLLPSTSGARGRRGERLARRFLQKKGFQVVKQNYRNRQGEVDLIVRQGDLVVFVEVKCRKKEKPGGPQGLVSRSQQRRLKRTARSYLRQTFGANPPDSRLDLIVIEELPDQDMVSHFPGAF